MKRAKLYAFVMAVMLASGMGVLNAQGRGAKPLTEDQKKIQAFQKEMQELDKEQENIEAKTAELDKTGDRLTDRIAVGVRGIELWKGMSEDLRRRYNALNARVRDHNVSCGGTFQDPDYVARCNSAAATLNGQKTALDQDAQRLETSRTGLQEGMAQLDRETEALTQAGNENIARQERLNVKRVQLRARILTFLEDLKKRESMSAECKKPGLSLETAHRCLQQVWDGAR